MRVINGGKPTVWDEKVVVEMSVKELALIQATMGNTSVYDDRKAFDRIFGEGTYDRIRFGTDFGYRVYKEIGNFLKEKGVLE